MLFFKEDNMKWVILLSSLLFSITLIGNSTLNAQVNDGISKPLPEFTHQQDKEWINSKPLKKNDLQGKVVLIDLWTFDCWNCYRSFPWLNALEKNYSEQDFQIIGIHTPEFEHEKIRTNIEAKVKEFKLHHPIMIDNDFSYWRALNNRYWPAYYLADKNGHIVYSHVGETHVNDRKAIALEKKLQELLAL